jgi:hypothetical protein
LQAIGSGLFPELGKADTPWLQAIGSGLFPELGKADTPWLQAIGSGLFPELGKADTRSGNSPDPIAREIAPERLFRDSGKGRAARVASRSSEGRP